MTDLGALRDVGDGRYELRFERSLRHPPEVVWQALIERDHLKAWFPARIDGERKTGASLQFVFENGEGPALAGEMVVFDPPRTLEFTWSDDRLRFELTPVNSGAATALVFINTFTELGKAARDAAGWHVCLHALMREVDGDGDGDGERPTWRSLQPRYAEAFGPDAATIGPPPGALDES